MKLRAYAQTLGLSYRTVWRWFKAGKIAGYQADTGTIIITEPIRERPAVAADEKVAIYARVSATENKDSLEGQATRLAAYCAAKGYQVTTVAKEIGSGVNDTRPKLLKLLTDPTITLIVIEHKDRLTRFGFNYLEQLLAMHHRRIEVILDERAMRYRSVQPAYSSQQCSHCGFSFKLNRRTQAEFRCLWCGFSANADENAARNLAERFGDLELNRLSFRAVEAVLAQRFLRRLPDARSVSAGLDPLYALSISPGERPRHRCL